MPKQKTNRSILKRFKLTKSGKIRRNKAFRRHLLAKRSRKRKRNLRRHGFVSGSERTSYLRLLAEK
jgi:large subunit ribosomal protein L35